METLRVSYGFSLQGVGRSLNADRFRVVPWYGGVLALVADGHGSQGEDAAAYAVTRLPEELERERFGFGGRLVCATHRVFDRVDHEITCRYAGGTTLTLVFVRNSTVFIAWVGDTRVTLISNASFRPLSAPHLPRNKCEQARIEMAGGKLWKDRLVHPSVEVIPDRGRVPSIAVSRSLGDRGYGMLVSHEPQCDLVSLGPTANMIQIATDGVWDAFTDSLVLDRDLRALYAGSTGACADRLERFLHEKRPSDDATVVLIDLATIRSTP